MRTCQRKPSFKALGIASALLAGIALGAGCGKVERERSTEKSEISQPRSKFGSPAWEKAAAEDIRVTMVSVLQKQDPSLKWGEERPGIALTDGEKHAIEAKHVTGELTAVMTQTRGSGSVEVRIVIIQHGPITNRTNIPVPERGSVIYIQEGASLVPLATNAPTSALVLQVIPQPEATAFWMDQGPPTNRTFSSCSLESYLGTSIRSFASSGLRSLGPVQKLIPI